MWTDCIVIVRMLTVSCVCEYVKRTGHARCSSIGSIRRCGLLDVYDIMNLATESLIIFPNQHYQAPRGFRLSCRRQQLSFLNVPSAAQPRNPANAVVALAAVLGSRTAERLATHVLITHGSMAFKLAPVGFEVNDLYTIYCTYRVLKSFLHDGMILRCISHAA